MPMEPDAERDDLVAQIAELRKETDRLRADAVSMKAATVSAEQRLGESLATLKRLEAELAHSYRNTVLVYKKVLRPIYLCFRWIPGVRQIAAHVKR